MKYTIDITETGCLETLSFSSPDGSRKYVKKHIKTPSGSRSEGEFCEKMEEAGEDVRLADEVYEILDDHSLPLDLMKIAILAGELEVI